jgi:hypothetical protein
MPSRTQKVSQKRDMIETVASPDGQQSDKEETEVKANADENSQTKIDENKSLFPIDPSIQIKEEIFEDKPSFNIDDDEEISIISPVKSKKRRFVLDDELEDSEGKFKLITILIN